MTEEEEEEEEKKDNNNSKEKNEKKLFSQHERQGLLSRKGPMDNKQARPLTNKLTITLLNILSMK
jgi:hypothetical protein